MQSSTDKLQKPELIARIPRGKFFISTVTLALYWVLIDYYFNNHKTTVVGVEFVLANGLAATKLALMAPALFAWIVFTIHSLFKHRLNKHLLETFKFHLESFYVKPVYSVIYLMFISKAIRYNSLNSEFMIYPLLSSILVSFLLYKILSSANRGCTKHEYLFLVLTAISTYTFFWELSHSLSAFLIIGIIGVLILFKMKRFENKKYKLFGINLIDTFLLPFVFVLSLLPINLRLNIHSFESAYFSNAYLASQGNLPWRDYLVEHGIWEDAYRYLLPEILNITGLVEKNLMIDTVVRPVEIFILFACIAYVLSSRPIAYFVILVGAILEILIDPVNTGFSILLAPRMFLLWPLIACWAAYLRRKSLISFFLLSLFSAINLIASPEGVYPLLGIILTHLTLKYKSASRDEYVWFPIKLCLSIAVISLMILLPANLLKYFVENYQISGDGYIFAWGAPFNFGIGLKYQMLFLLVPLTIIGLMIIFTSVLEMRRSISVEFQKNLESVAIFTPLLFTSFCLYVKFLRWPDWHILQSFSILYPLIVIILLIYLNKNKTIHIKFKGSIPKLFLLGGLVLFLITLPKSLSSEEPANDSKYLSSVSDSQKEVGEYLKLIDNKNILDFGNEPFTWFYGSDFRPAGGISKTMNILTDKSQKIAIDRIRKSDPQLVILGSGYGYWMTPFENWVSKYAISEYIFKNFTPFRLANGYLLMRPKDEEVLNLELQNWLNALPCNLGDIQNQFDLPRLTSQSLSVSDGQVIELSNETQALKIKSKDIGKYEMENQRSGSRISFEIRKSNYSGSIPLLGCPAWIFSEKTDLWKFNKVK
jgi:hypothetical protein